MFLEKVKIPEDAGVNSAVVLEFFNLMKEMGVENHGFVIIKDEKIALENYTAPFGPQYAHSCFSVSKGLISTAVAYAIEDGTMSLDTPILKYYPEYEEYAKKEPRNAKITIRDLLLMSSGKKCKFVKDMTKGNYADDWIKYKFRKDNNFMYSNDDVYMIAKAITRIYKCSIIDFLMPRLFEPLGIERPFWETTIEGVEAGATGLYLKTMDLAKIAYCYACDGMWDGKQVIPKEWTQIAGQYYVDLPPYYNTSKKYGYFFWGDPNGDYRFDGMYGQWAIVLKKYNAAVVFNDSSCNVQAFIDEMWKYFPRAFIEKSDGSKIEELQALLKKNEEFEVPKADRSPNEKEFEGKYKLHSIYKIGDAFNQPVSMMPMVDNGTMPQHSKKSMDKLDIKFTDTSIVLNWSEGEEINTIEIGLDGTIKESNTILGTFPFKTVSYGQWLDENKLEVIIRFIETPVSRKMVLKFKKNKIKIKVTSIPTVKEFVFGYIGEVSIKPTPFVKAMLTPVLKVLEPTLTYKRVKE
ncbi:MAG: serine hydrolase [Clostridia bacterium]|nr:serine hydrolase [Clostridia bacterium]